MSDEIQSLPPESEALALQCLAGRVKKQLDLTKTEFSQDYQRGDKHTFRSPVDGSKLGIVYRTDPDASWIVTDHDALVEHLMTFPGYVVASVRVADSAPLEEILPVLAEHAPHLLEDVEVLREGVIDAALEQTRQTGIAVAPGITRIQSGGSLTVKPDPQAHLAIEGMVREGLLTWDGRRALPAYDDQRST